MALTFLTSLNSLTSPFAKVESNWNRRHFFFSLLNRLKAEFNDVSCDLWYFYETSCKINEKVSFLYYAVYQIFIRISYWIMILWYIFPQKTFMRKQLFSDLSFDCSGLWNDIYVISVLVVTQKAPKQPFSLVFYDYQWKE